MTLWLLLRLTRQTELTKSSEFVPSALLSSISCIVKTDFVSGCTIKRTTNCIFVAYIQRLCDEIQKLRDGLRNSGSQSSLGEAREIVVTSLGEAGA